MRIAAVNSHHARIGGAETYLDTVIPALAAADHQIAFYSEFDAPPGAPLIRLPDRAPLWCASAMGTRQALAALEQWRPDVIYVHGMYLQSAAPVVEIAPVVLFAHGYYGTCISGNKMFAAPRPRPCARRFGLRCFVHYYPHRCGGLNPMRMLLDYSSQAARLALMRRYAAILTTSDHMRAEFVRHGLSPERVHTLRPPLAPDRFFQPPAGAENARVPATADRELRLLFAGRMTGLKGGLIMIDALAPVASALKRPLRVTFVGDGPDRPRWEQRARRAQTASSNLQIEFTGWLDPSRLGQLMLDSDLLVVPSTWPEPFGLVGPEAGVHGLPAAAFAVGGIPEWLRDGVNGRLAPGDPPSAAGLAHAIVECVRDPAELARLKNGAREQARRYGLQAHIDALLAIFASVTGVKAAAMAR
ncbi:MAG TPA: glycosyltransferase family 4 protein [Candidatus Binataceae bacterium]|nr:glycosyltransferase family 4 protein [Candidatus Binataceae bacterium]